MTSKNSGIPAAAASPDTPAAPLDPDTLSRGMAVLDSLTPQQITDLGNVLLCIGAAREAAARREAGPVRGLRLLPGGAA